MGLIYGLLRSQREEVSIPLASVGVKKLFKFR
jgi:hypothetical protein